MTWPEALALYADHLDQVERSLHAGMPKPPDAPTVPDDLPPLPSPLRHEAMRLLRRGEALTDQVAAARAAIGEELQRQPRRPHHGPGRPSMLDTRA